MAKLLNIPSHGKGPSLKRSVMVDTVRGVLRVRKWPKKRGKPTHPVTLWWNDWFRQANRLAKYVDAATARRAIALTKGTPLYPRDIILAAMRGRLYAFTDENGWKWYPMAGIQDISDTLDMLGQTVGDVLVRATDRWRPPPAGASGEVLTHQGAGSAPEWQPAAGGGGFSGGALAGRTTNFSIGAGASVAIPFTSEYYDTAGIHDNVTNNTRLSVPVGTSWVKLWAQLRWQSYIKTACDIRPNGGWTGPITYMNMQYAIGMNISTPPLAVIGGTDYFEFVAYNGSGGAKNILGTAWYPWFGMELL